MIDLHCHILPGVDDGAKNIQDSILMAEKAVSQGITHILCTPHHMNGIYENTATKVIRDVERLQDVLDKKGIPLTLLEGQEVRIFGTLLDAIDSNEILFTDLENKYILIEFPTSDVPLYTEQLFLKLLSLGHTPVIVHPERNMYFREEPNRLIPFIEMGVITQLTAPSILGIFGKKIQKTSIQMMKQNLLHTVASDAHNLNHRTFYLKEAYDYIGMKFGIEKVREMQTISRDLINGDEIKVPDYFKIKRGFKFF